ncbi:MAG: hypothetical protein ACNA7E_03000 [Wenzhouxiangellaceae bacterium]
MAIIHCPACNQRMSSVAKACPACHEPVGELSEEQRQTLLMRRWRDRIYRARNFTYLAMALVVFGLLGWWMSEPQGLAMPVGTIPAILLSVGVVGYLLGWGWLLWVRLREDPRRRR